MTQEKKSEIEKRADILRRFKGYLNEKIYSEVAEAMDELRKFHNGEKGTDNKGIKGVVRESEEALNKAKKSLKSKEFLQTSLSIGNYYKINKKLLISIKEYIKVLETKYQEAYDDIDDQHLDAIEDIKNVMETSIEQRNPAHAELEKTLLDPSGRVIKSSIDYNLISEAGFFDWFRSNLSKQDITDKLFQSRSKSFKKDSTDVVKAAENLQNYLNSILKNLDQAIAHRDIGDYIEVMGKFANNFSKFEKVFKKYYSNWLDKVLKYKQQEKEQRQKEIEQSKSSETVEQPIIEENKPAVNYTHSYGEVLNDYVSRLFNARLKTIKGKSSDSKEQLLNLLGSFLRSQFGKDAKSNEIFKYVDPKELENVDVLNDALSILQDLATEYFDEYEEVDVDFSSALDGNVKQEQQVKGVIAPQFWLNKLINQNIPKEKWIEVVQYNLQKQNIDDKVKSNIIDFIRKEVGNRTASEFKLLLVKNANSSKYNLAKIILSYSDKFESIDNNKSLKLLAIAEGILNGNK